MTSDIINCCDKKNGNENVECYESECILFNGYRCCGSNETRKIKAKENKNKNLEEKGNKNTGHRFTCNSRMYRRELHYMKKWHATD